MMMPTAHLHPHSEKKNGFTQGTLAEELKVAKGTVSAWEIGSRRPSFGARYHV